MGVMINVIEKRGGGVEEEEEEEEEERKKGEREDIKRRGREWVDHNCLTPLFSQLNFLKHNALISTGREDNPIKIEKTVDTFKKIK